MLIRPETIADEWAIGDLIERAFANTPFSNHAEQHIVNTLREAKALVVSLVAEQDQTVVGHVACSPVSIAGAQHWYGLGPLAVEPTLQRQGIGSALVRAGLERLLAVSARGCVVFGDPRYYGRFGFKAVAGLAYPGLPSRYFMAQTFAGSVPQGDVAYHAAFGSAA